ncbi:hypothetical protein RJ639_002712 [Escallonia herrerae]|uniref:RING-type E3 ubiquitin transferase n=1 Tax=Escallonia herrerae TaxID=1293975 RepID=A0AA88W376_9ASTE|nr:hypothetical protein RJ639_002712 [Escallonia herrerae]
MGYRIPRNQSITETDPIPPPIPSIIQSTRCKSTISSLLLSTFTPTTSTTDEPITTSKKKNPTSAKFRGLGCAAPPQVSVPAVIRTSASWEEKKGRRKKKNKGGPGQGGLAMGAPTDNPPMVSSSSCVVVPDVWCGPGIGFTTDAASVDCVVSRRPVSGRGKIDGDKINHRERSSCTGRRMVNTEEISFFDTDPAIGRSRPRLDVFGSRHHRHVRHRSPDGLAEIVMLQSSLLKGERSDRLDRYQDLRLDVDNMSYEELLELGDRIGYVSTGLEEDEIIRCLGKTTLSILDDLSSHFRKEMQWKCSICQEEYEADDEMGKLDCGHFYHMQCIKQWLGQKNACPICKTSVVSEE